MADGSQDVIRHALRVARERGFTTVELSFEDTQFEARLSPSDASEPRPAVAPDENPAEEPELGLVDITAPVVGFVRDAGEPLTVGQQVEKGNTVAVVASLGLANEVEAPVSGEIVEVLVESG